MFLQFRQSRLVATAALLAGLIAAVAVAAESPPANTPAPNASAPHCGKHGGMDMNKMKERGAKVFAMVDTNGDGKITDVEFLAAKPPHGHGGHRMGMGAGMGHGPGKGGHPGKHGTPPPTEAQKLAFDADLFKALDTDGNGQLSAAEFAKAHDVMRTMMKKKAFVRFDTNTDGVLTTDEFPPFPTKMAAMDTDGDGTVTREEMHSAKQASPSTTPH